MGSWKFRNAYSENKNAYSENKNAYSGKGSP